MIDTRLTDEITCPHCGHTFSDSWEYDFYGGGMVDCVACSKEFEYWVDISVAYTTYKLRGAE